MKFLLSTVVAAAAVANAAAPVLPTEWSTQNFHTTVLIFQGGSHNDTAETACCSDKAPQCKVQTEGLIGKMAVDLANNRTSFIVGQQNLLTLGAPINKQFTASMGSDGKWSCQSYCPTQGPVQNPLNIDPKAKDQGKVTVQGKSTEHWQWSDEIFGVVKMDTVDFYLDQSGAKPVPYYQTEKLTPFGGGEIGFTTSLWNDFTEGKPDASAFDVPDLSSCELSDQCQQNTVQKKFFQRMLSKPTLAELTREARLTPAKEAATVPGGNWTWATDFSAFETNGMVINQGGIPSKDGDSVCCVVTGLSQCQVQIEYQEGQKYYDYTNQRTRFEGGGQVIVDLFDKHKELLVVHNGTHDVCQEYCPIDPADTLDKGAAAFLEDDAYDAGQAKFEGLNCEHWTWNDTIFKKIVMQTSDFYADTSKATVVPVGRVDNITPFGQHLGTANIGWQKFTAGTPPADKFDIQGVDTCPMSNQCGQSSRQLHRLANRKIRTYERYATLPTL